MEALVEVIVLLRRDAPDEGISKLNWEKQLLLGFHNFCVQMNPTFDRKIQGKIFYIVEIVCYFHRGCIMFTLYAVVVGHKL